MVQRGTPQVPDMATKTKIRLLLDAKAMQRVGRLPEVRAVRRGRANKRRVRAVYFDTPAADLRHAGATLWTRKEGGRWIQSLGLDGQAAGGLHLQEWPLAGPTLDWKVLRETALRVFRNARFRKALDAAFETDFIRTSIALVLADGTCGELRLDSGEVVAGKRRAPISEIEIELIEGDRARLFDFAIGLVEALLPVRVSDAGKSARGYALMPGLSAVPVKARIPALSEDMHVEDAFAEIGRSCLAQMQANETGVSAARDPEFLHQYRVGLRRLRSAFGLFGPVLAAESAATVVREIRWLSTYLGSARDWDVFCEQTLMPLSQRADRDPAMAALQRRCARERASCAALVRETIASPRYAKFVLKLGRLFATLEQGPGTPPLKAFAAARLQKRDRGLGKIARGLDVSDSAQVHAMRIAAKKLRYTSEFVQSLFPKKAATDHARSLARLQDVLGDVNDSTTGLRLLDSLPPDRSEAGTFARGLVRESLAARKELALGALSSHWDELRHQKRYWKAALPPPHAAADEAEQAERETG